MGPAIDIADTERCALGRAQIARQDGLQAEQEMAEHHGRVGGEMRRRAPMAAGACEGHAPEIGAGQDRARPRGELADRDAGRIMQAIDAVAGKAVEQPVGNHGRGAGSGLLGRLEDEMHRAGEIGRLGEIFGGAEQHRRMPVMAAGMHLAGHDRGMREVIRLLDEQRVHVGAQPDGALPGALALQRADDAGLADALGDLDPPAAQLSRRPAPRCALPRSVFPDACECPGGWPRAPARIR